MSEYVETIVIGGGQAGLSASWHLKKAGREHLVLDRGRIGDTWRHRWDSFCLVSQNWLCQLPEFPYDGDDPDGFMLRDQIVDYVERFARSYAPPYRGNIDVHRMRHSNHKGRFELDTSEGTFCADRLIVATGAHQQPNIPTWAGKLAGDIAQLHSCDYRNPQQFPDGAVLVIGSGQSGCQIVEDLLFAGREVHLSVSKAGRLQRRYRGRDMSKWAHATGFFDTPVDEHPLGEEIRFRAQWHTSGRNGGRTIDLRRLALDGVRLHGRLLDADGATVSFAGDLASNLDLADRMCRERLSQIDDYIAKNGIDAPPEELVPVAWQPFEEPPTIDLKEAGIGTVIYGTGFHPDFRWIDMPVFDGRGYPRTRRGVTEIPGLHFLGLHWLHTMGSGLFYGVGRDAEHVVSHICRTRH
jgi:putative flavoprotein involved in K+ transport